MGIKAIGVTDQNTKEVEEMFNHTYNPKHGKFRLRSSSFYKQYSKDSIRLFLHQTALYALPTEELIDFLKGEIGDKSAIEVGCGTGFIAKELGVLATDLRIQEDPSVAMWYKMHGQPVIKYPDYVEKLEGVEAVKKYKPQVAFGCYITDGETNHVGIRDARIIPLVDKYIHIGDEHTHRDKLINKLPHERIRPEWLICRGKKPYIGIWK